MKLDFRKKDENKENQSTLGIQLNMPKVDIKTTKETTKTKKKDDSKSFNFSINDEVDPILQEQEKKELLKQYDQLNQEIKNYSRKEKNPWWDNDKNIVENVGNVLYKTFLEKQDDKYTDDDTYKKLIEEKNRIENRLEDIQFKNQSENMSTIAKVGNTIFGNLETSAKGINSTVNKLLGNTPNQEKQSVTERLSDEAINQTSNLAGKTALSILGSTARMVPQMAVGSPIVSSAIGFANYGGSAYNEAKRNGATEDQATKYGATIGALETGLEKVLGGFENIYGKSATGKLTNKIMGKLVKNDSLRKTLSGMTGEFTEEYLQEFIEPIVKNTILEEKNGADFWNTMKEDFSTGLKQLSSQLFNKENLYAGGVGALTSGMFSGIDNLNSKIKSNINSRQVLPKASDNNQNNSIVKNDLNSENQNNYKYIKSDNNKIDNLRKSASLFFNDSNETNSLIDTYEKIISDKDYNITFDNTINDNNGNIVNAKINSLENGEVEIKINPNSDRAGEFLIMHEVTHAIETDEIKNIVMDYASKNSEFNSALESLKQTYGTDDVSSEVLADISGQLFGNQEFINNLSMQKPNVFKRIYNKIVELANKITGNSKESLFIKDLKNKWENAYRTQNNNLIDSKYSIGGLYAIQNLDNSNYKQDALNNYQKAQQMKQQGYSNEEIRKNTKWFQDKYGKWKFEFSDELINVKNILNKNTTYKLADIIEHPYLFKLYPELKNYNIKFEEMKSNASHFFNEKIIRINNNLINSPKNMSGTLLHEIQHAIQHYEGFSTGTTSRYGKVRYVNRLGEIEAADTKNRYLQNLDNNKRKLIAPESSKSNPQHPNKDKILKSKVEKTVDKIYNKFSELEVDIDEENNYQSISKNNKNNSISNLSNKRRNSLDNNILFGGRLNETFKKSNSKDYQQNRSLVDGGRHLNGNKELDNSSFSLSSKNNDNKWQEHLENNYKTAGTRTKLNELKGILPTAKTQNIVKEIPKDPTKEESYENVDNYNIETNNIKDMLSKYTSLERSELISEKTYDSINGELRKLGQNLDDKTVDNLTNKVFKSLIDGKDIKNISNTVYNTIYNPRKVKVAEYRNLAANMIDDIAMWNDKKIGLSYQTETMKRNIYDIIPDKAKAKEVYETYFQTISENEATAKKFINQYNNKIKKLDLNNKESVAVQMYGEYKYNPETKLTGLQVDEYIEKNNLDLNKIKNSVEVFRNTYDELINKVNNVLIEQGYKPIEYRKGYFPHFVTDKPTSIIGKFAEKLGWKINKNNLPTDIAGMSEIFKPGKRWTSFSQQRTGDTTDYNALKGFDTYIRGASDLIYHTEDIQKLRALENEIRYQYSSDTIKNEINEINNDSDLDVQEKQDEIDKIYEKFNNQMPNFVTELRRYTDGLANKKAIDDRNMEHKLNREIYSTMTNIQNRVNANMVGLNVSSAFTNFIPITQGYSQISSKNMLKAIKQTIANQVRNDGFDNNSTFLTNRLKNPDNLYKTGLDKFNDKASILFEGIDSITSNILVRGKYYDNIAKGMSEAEAMKNADEFAKDVMAGRSKGEMPTIYNEKNPITKLFTSFQLEVKNQYGYMFKDIPRDLKDEGMKRMIGAFFKMFAGAWLYNKFAESLTGRESAFSPVDIVEETISTVTNKNLSTYDKLEKITTSSLQELPFIGGLLGGGRLPINSAIPDVKTFEYFVNSFSDDSDKKTKAINNLKKELAKPIMYLVLPVGGGQLKKTYEGLSMYSKDKDVKGSYTASGELRFPVKKDILSIAQSAVFGQYSSEEAREYFDRGETPLTEKQLESYKKLNVPITKYWKYRQDLKEINKIQGDKDENGNTINGSASGKKAYEIMNNNLYSTKEKNYLLSELSNSENKETINSLKILTNDEDVYKYYFSLNNDNKKKFKNAIKKYQFTAKELTKFNNSIDKTDSTSKNQSITKYLLNSDFNDEQIAYLYEKNGYSSEEKLKSILNSNISMKSYLDLKSRIKDIKGNIDLKSNVEGKTISGSKKKKVLKEINNTKGLTKEQKLLTAYLEGYSITTGDFAGYTTYSSRKIVFDYVNSLKISIDEKRDILDKAGYKIYKNGRIGW